MNNLMQDINYALRALLKRPLYASITIFVLALAIGANSTVFSVFNGLFLRSLPFPDDEQLVAVYNSYPRTGLEYAGTSIPDYLDRREHADSLEEIAIYTMARYSLGFEGEPEQLTLLRTSPSLFDVLGVSPLIGRTFTEEEAVPGNENVIVIGHRLWQERFGQREDVIGSDLTLNGEPYTIVGVMPRGFEFPLRDVEAWIPFAWTQEEAGDDERGTEYSASIGRLKPGSTLQSLQTELETIIARNAEQIPSVADVVASSGFTARAESYRDHLVGDLRQMVLLLQAIVFAVLVIACANLANLQLARVTARRKELSIRMSLGAQRARLTGLVMTESLVLAACGALVGLLIAYGGIELIRMLGLDHAQQGFEFVLDPSVLVFTALVAIVSGVLAALLPVVSLWRENLSGVIQGAGRLGGGNTAGQVLRRGLVVIQIAISLALLGAAGLLTKSFYEIQAEGPGFETDDVLTASVFPPSDRYADEERAARYYERVTGEMRALPGVTHAVFTAVIPFSGNSWGGSYFIDGHEIPEGSRGTNAHQNSVNEDFFPGLSIPILRGRNFEASESERVAIVDERFVERHWPDGEPLGQRIRFVIDDEDEWYTIIGVARSVKHTSLAEPDERESIYWHYQQRPTPFGGFMIKSEIPAERLSQQMSDAALSVDPQLPLFGIQTLDSRVMNTLGPQRTSMVLTVVFAVVALILAVVGTYGVLSWAVTQRYAEVGLRMALGARHSDIVRMVLWQGGRLVSIGVVLGLAFALALGQVLAANMLHVEPVDSGIFAGVTLTLIATALLASWFPARRAAQTDPMLALREE